jgi:hypothetical protein
MYFSSHAAARSPIGIAIFLSLALADGQRAAFDVQVVQFQVGQFQTAHPGRVERFEQGPVAKAERVVNVRLHEHAFRLGDSKHVLRQAMSETRQLQFARRVVEDEPLARHPAEPHAQGDQPRVLAAEAERLPVFLAVVEQVPLIAFEHGPRHVERFLDAALVAPLDEEADMHPAVLHGVAGVIADAQRFEMLLHDGGQGRGGRRFGLAPFPYPSHGYRAPASTMAADFLAPVSVLREEGR